jgi:hypothetical protein
MPRVLPPAPGPPLQAYVLGVRLLPELRGLLLSSRFDCLKESSRIQNANTPERIEYKQVLVAAHNRFRAAVDGQFQELVVARIAASLNRRSNWHKLRGLTKTSQKFFASPERQNPAKLGSTQHLFKLGKRLNRREQPAPILNPISHLRWKSVRDKQRADHYIRVQDR